MRAQTIHDIRYALRLMARSPIFSAVVILTLALGLGANAAIFSVTDRVLLQSLPVTDPDQLAVVAVYEPKEAPDYQSSFSYPMYQDLRDKNDVFSGVIARGGTQMNLSYQDQNERVRGELVSGNFFDVLGVRPFAGRFFTQEDDRVPAERPVAVLSYNFWSSRFAKDPGIIGQTILINEHPMIVVAVSPPGFYGINLSNDPDVRVPLMMTEVFSPTPPLRLQKRNWQWLNVMARIKPNVTSNQAQASLDLLYRQLRSAEAQLMTENTTAAGRERFMAQRISLQPGGQGLQHVQKEMRTSLWLLLGATGAVLLILCANLTNLMMARATARAQETAVRLALGAGGVRLLRQWLTEGLVLSFLGGALGVVVALWIKTGLLSFIPESYRNNLASPSDWRLYLFIFLISLLVGVLFSFAPALKAARQEFVPGLRLESRSFTSAGRVLSLRSGLVLGQVALSLPLLVTAALLVRSLQNLRAVDTGFGKENVLLASINPALNGYSPEKTHAFYNDLLTRTRALPGVVSATLASDSPVSGGWDQNGIVVEDYTPKENERMACDVTYTSADYFKTLSIPLVAGRDFNEQDRLGGPKVAVINEKMAHYFFGTSNPLGKRIGLDKVPDVTIVGVVKDARYINLREGMRRHFYLPTTQLPLLSDLALHVKTQSDPAAVAAMLRAEIRQIDPHLPLYNIKTLSSEIDESLVQERLVTWLSSAFGILATLLTALGLYGVLAFSVARRTREIGIRVALGAQRRDVFGLIMTRGLILVGVGVVAGIGISFAMARSLEALLFGIAPNNIPVIIASSVGLMLIALIACYIPARRATKVDPLIALRCE